jgi:hypothetical protein
LLTQAWSTGENPTSLYRPSTDLSANPAFAQSRIKPQSFYRCPLRRAGDF